MDEKGVYAIARSIWDDADFMKQKYTQREAWMWLIGAAVWKQTTINLDGKRVTLERGEFAFSIRFLAQKWKWAKTTVSRFLVTLEKRCWIRDAGRDRVAVFSIVKYNDFQVVGLPRGTSNGTASGTDVGQQRDKEETLQALEEKKDKKRAPALRVVPPKPLPDWLPLEAWAAFLAMRRKIKKVPTDYAIDLLLAKLAKFRLRGHDPTEILDYSTQNNYPGIFEPKADRNGQRKQSPHETAYSVARDYCAEILAGGQGSEGGGVDETALALLPAGANGGSNTGRH